MTLRPLLCAAALAALLPTAPVLAEAHPGAYLAARHADREHDFQVGAGYLTESLIGDPTNPTLLESGIIAFAGLGQFDRAEILATQMLDTNASSQLAHLIRNVQAAKSGDWDLILSDLEAGREVGPLVDALSQAWAQVGKGRMTNAISAFDMVIETAGLASFGQLHKAYALASVGDFEGANTLFTSGPNGGLRYTARSAVAHAQILSQLDDNASAIAVLDGVFGTSQDPRITSLLGQLADGETLPFTYTPNASAGMAEIYFAVAKAVEDEAPDDYTLIYARAASYLDPDNSDAIILAGALLEDLGQYDLANDAYRSVPDDNHAFQVAELGRAGALSQAGKEDAGIEVLQALTASAPDYARGYAALGDALRRQDNYPQAIAAYTTALDLYSPNHPTRWFVYYMRAITHHLSDDWPAAEADFRASLALEPDRPDVLNYLGYSMVERGINLDEALDMIERAVDAQPQNGAIVDSLGWVLFQFGKYSEAVGHLETAASLLAVDPVINDHLGDAYWAVGRDVEAHFQWNRALSFDPTEDDAARIRRKLEIGLDAVLAEEGAEPLKATDVDN